MSVTESYKTVTFSANQVEQVKFALDDRAGMLARFINVIDERYSPDSFAIYTRWLADVNAMRAMLTMQMYADKYASKGGAE